MRPFDGPCDTTYKAAHDSGPRTAKAIRFIVLHSTEGDTAAGAASWFANPKSEGSANLVVDDDICYRTVDDLRIPWAAPGKNTDGFHIEIAGHAAWTRAQWLQHRDAIERAAYKTVARAKRYNIPLKKRTFIGVRLGRPGICGHRDCSFAFPLIAKQFGFHTDPGKNFPWDVFMKYVQRFAKA